MRRLLRRVLPGAREIRGRGSLRRVFGRMLLDTDLWHLNRSSVAWAVSIGLFVAWMPVPFQMIIAAGAAIAVRCNLPVSVLMVWISNPVTVAPMFFSAHKLGAWMLGVSLGGLEFELSLRWLFDGLGKVWEPFLLGCFVMGIASALLGQAAVRLIWRAHVVVSWRERRARRRQPRRDEPGPAGRLPPAPAAEVHGEREPER